MNKKTIDDICHKVLSQIKAEHKLVAFIQFGSSLTPKQMTTESDIDLMAIIGKKVKGKINNIGFGVEVNIHFYSLKELKTLLKEGFPLAIMALKYGKVLFGKNIVKQLRAAPNDNTIETWYKTGRRVYSMALMDYFSEFCVGCYLKSCHSSARTLLRSYILKHYGVLCKDDIAIQKYIPKPLENSYARLLKYRKNPDFRFNLSRNKMAEDVLTGKQSQPFLCLEEIFAFMVKDFEGKEIVRVRNAISELKGQIHTIIIDKEYVIFRPNMKPIKIKLYKTVSSKV